MFHNSTYALVISCALIASSAASASAQVTPIFEGAEVDGAGNMTAWFGYNNAGPETTVPVGVENFVVPGNAYRGQPTVFEPGRHHCVFSISFNTATTSSIAWWLLGAEATTDAAVSSAEGTTYQGRLLRNGVPLSGSADLIFSLWRSATSQAEYDRAAPDVERLAVPITDGLFTARFSFGTAPDAALPPGAPARAFPHSVIEAEPGYWVEVAVRFPPGAGTYTTLSPRQPLVPAPAAVNAAHARRAAFANELRAPADNSLAATAQPGSVLALTHAGLSGDLTVMGVARIKSPSSAPDAPLTIDPQGAGYIHIGAPNFNSGGGTSLRMGITAASGGEAEISAIKSAGSTYGDIVLNRSGGRVAIGNVVPSFQLQLSQNSAAKPGGGSWSDSSDARLKHNIMPLENALDRLLALRGVTYEWNEPAKHGGLVGPQIGMIAQDVRRVFPDWIGTDDAGYLTLGFRGFEALTVEALRQLNRRCDDRAALAEEVTRLREQNAVLESRIERLERLLAER